MIRARRVSAAAGSASSSSLHASKSGSGDLTPHLSRLLAGCNFQASLGQNPQLRNRGTNGRRMPHRRDCGTPLPRMAFTARAVEQLYFGANRRLPRRIRIVSKQDTHFFNVFSMVIGLLVAVAIALFALARAVASQTQDKQVVEDASYVKNVEQRVEPFAQEAVAGQDNSALAIKADAA